MELYNFPYKSGFPNGKDFHGKIQLFVIYGHISISPYLSAKRTSLYTAELTAVIFMSKFLLRGSV